MGIPNIPRPHGIHFGWRTCVEVYNSSGRSGFQWAQRYRGRSVLPRGVHSRDVWYLACITWTLAVVCSEDSGGLPALGCTREGRRSGHVVLRRTQSGSGEQREPDGPVNIDGAVQMKLAQTQSMVNAYNQYMGY